MWPLTLALSPKERGLEKEKREITLR